MAHPRKLIRDQVVSLLETEATIQASGWRVLRSRVPPVDLGEYPDRRVLLVYGMGDGEPELLAEGPRTWRRTTRIEVGVVVDASSGAETESLDDTVDDLAELAERRILGRPDHTLGGLIHDLRYAGTDVVANVEGERPTWGLALAFDADFLTDQTGEIVPADASGIDVDWFVSGQDPDTDDPGAEDVIDLEPSP